MAERCDALPRNELGLRETTTAASPATTDGASVATTSTGLSSLAYWLQLMRQRKAVLAITDDGTANGRLLALLTDRSLSNATGRRPAQLLAALRAADSSVERRSLTRPINALLTETLTGPTDWDTVAELAGLFSDALAESVLRQALRDAASPTSPASAHECWMVFGRSARGEVSRLVRSDIGVVYADLPHEWRVSVEDGHVAVVSRMDRLWAECGFAACEDRGAPSAPVSASVGEWRSFFRGIVTAPIDNDVYAQRQRLDFRALLGDAALADGLRDALAEDLKGSSSFIAVLANDTMDHLPPLTFYRGLVIDAEGVEAPSVDLRLAALGPLVDAARVFALAAGRVGAQSTLDRLQVAAAWLPHAQARFNEAAGAFRVVSYHAAWAARASTTGAPVIEPATLSKVEQRLLKTAFESVSAMIEFTARPDRWTEGG
jgi:CBS domain-containing protein